MSLKTPKYHFLAQTILGLICLFLPFVFMKIGPGGYKYYGPTVPDIYIFGGYIFGKDVSWPGINFAYKFQFICITSCIIMSLLCFLNPAKKKMIYPLQIILTLFILLFPFWIYIYTGGVRNNSDCADLTIYPHIGWIAYAGLVYLQIGIFRKPGKLKLEKSIA